MQAEVKTSEPTVGAPSAVEIQSLAVELLAKWGDRATEEGFKAGYLAQEPAVFPPETSAYITEVYKQAYTRGADLRIRRILKKSSYELIVGDTRSFVDRTQSKNEERMEPNSVFEDPNKKSFFKRYGGYLLVGLGAGLLGFSGGVVYTKKRVMQEKTDMGVDTQTSTQNK
jgi:hypothetical protein